jgi:hypothetical protein
MRITVRAHGISFYFENDGPYIGIGLRIVPDNPTAEVAEHFKRYFTEHPDVVRPSTNFGQHHFVVHGEDLRYVIDTLYHASIFDPEMRSNLEPLIRQAEQYHDYTTRLIDRISLAQKEVLISFIEPYLDGLFTDELHQVLKLIAAIQHCSSIPVLGVAFSNASQREDVNIIAKVYSGLANLESVLIQSGDSLPKKDIQQKVIDQFLYESIISKFNITNNDIKFVLHMALTQREIYKLLSAYPDINHTTIDEDALRRFFHAFLGTGRSFFERYEPARIMPYVMGSLSGLGVLFNDLNLKKYMAPEQLALCSKLVGEDDVCGPRFFQTLDRTGRYQADPWNTVSAKIDGDLDRCGPGYGF